MSDDWTQRLKKELGASPQRARRVETPDDSPPASADEIETVNQSLEQSRSDLQAKRVHPILDGYLRAELVDLPLDASQNQLRAKCVAMYFVHQVDRNPRKVCNIIARNLALAINSASLVDLNHYVEEAHASLHRRKAWDKVHERVRSNLTRTYSLHDSIGAIREAYYTLFLLDRLIESGRSPRRKS